MIGRFPTTVMCPQVNHMLVFLLVLISGTLSVALFSPEVFLRNKSYLPEGVTQQERQILQETSPLWLNCVLKGNCKLPDSQKDIFKNKNPLKRRNVMLVGTRLYNLRNILRRMFSLVVALRHRMDSPQAEKSLRRFLDTWQPEGRRRQQSFIKRLHTCPFLNRVGFSPSICTLPRAQKLRRQRQTLANPISLPPVRRYPTGLTHRLHDTWPVLHLLGGALGKRTIA